MITVDPVLETHDAAGFTAWPIGAPPEDHFLALSGRMSPADVGTAMAVVFEYNGIPVTHLTDARLHRHLAETEGLLAPAGCASATPPPASPSRPAAAPAWRIGGSGGEWS